MAGVLWFVFINLPHHQIASSRSASPAIIIYPGQALRHFQYLRQVDLLGSQCLMLKHKHTAQRIALIVGQPGSTAAYRTMYSQPLSKFQFAMLMELFKPNSKFSNSRIEVLQVRRQPEKRLESKSVLMPYQTYLVETRIDGAPLVFKSYLGLLRNRQNVDKGLVFTFNTVSGLSNEPFLDLLDDLSEITVKQPS